MTVTVYPAQNAETPLAIPTYDGSGQCVHPSVLYNADGWNGYKYWMAMTPYPDQNDDYENPSIVASNDGDTWVVPDGLTNPIIPFPGGSLYNSDPDIAWSEDGSSIHLYYRLTSINVYDKFYVVTSSDGVTWSQPVLVFEYSGTDLRLSPSCLYDNETWKIWCVQKDRTLINLSCDTYNGTFTKTNDCIVLNQPPSLYLWHIDINKYGSSFHGLFNYYGNAPALYFAQSADGINWQVESTPILTGSAAGWDNKIYRASGIATSNGYDLFYSAFLSKSPHIGRTTMPMSTKRILLKR